MQRAELIAEALATAGRKNCERGFPFQDFGDNRFLTFTKGVKTEDVFERRMHGGSGRLHDGMIIPARLNNGQVLCYDTAGKSISST
jgi:hypothetical protein